jgi:hypothetical protein
MKTVMFLLALITAGFISSDNGPTNGTYLATGTITFTAGGTKYTCNISKVIAASTSLTIQTSTNEVKTNGAITVTCYTAQSAIVPGTYSAASKEKIASVSFFDKTFNPYSSTATVKGSVCSVNITALTSAKIKGTFTATVLKALDNSKLEITGGVIDCTIVLNK